MPKPKADRQAEGPSQARLQQLYDAVAATTEVAQRTRPEVWEVRGVGAVTLRVVALNAFPNLGAEDATVGWSRQAEAAPGAPRQAPARGEEDGHRVRVVRTQSGTPEAPLYTYTLDAAEDIHWLGETAVRESATPSDRVEAVLSEALAVVGSLPKAE